jgi:hypothetical protein
MWAKVLRPEYLRKSFSASWEVGERFDWPWGRIPAVGGKMISRAGTMAVQMLKSNAEVDKNMVFFHRAGGGISLSTERSAGNAVTYKHSVFNFSSESSLLVLVTRHWRLPITSMYPYAPSIHLVVILVATCLLFNQSTSTTLTTINWLIGRRLMESIRKRVFPCKVCELELPCCHHFSVPSEKTKSSEPG